PPFGAQSARWSTLRETPTAVLSRPSFRSLSILSHDRRAFRAIATMCASFYFPASFYGGLAASLITTAALIAISVKKWVTSHHPQRSQIQYQRNDWPNEPAVSPRIAATRMSGTTPARMLQDGRPRRRRSVI